MIVRILGGRAVSKVDIAVKDGDHLPLGEHDLQIIHTPGHSPGSICLYTIGHLFSGDTLFVGGVGRTDLPGASTKVLEHSLRTKILSLPLSTRIWPGHDYGRRPSNLLEQEIKENSFLMNITKHNQQSGEH